MYCNIIIYESELRICGQSYTDSYMTHFKSYISELQSYMSDHIADHMRQLLHIYDLDPSIYEQPYMKIYKFIYDSTLNHI